MTVNESASQPHIVFCGCAHYDIIPRTAKQQIPAGLSQHGVEVEMIDDLCGLAAHRDPKLRDWAQAEALTIVACYPRAVRWLFHAAGSPLAKENVRFFNMRTQAADAIISGIANWTGGSVKAEGLGDGSRILMKDHRQAALDAATPNHQSSIINHQSSWVPWFPVIDYDRCHNCKQCLNFCLFGVYELSEEGRVEVRKPSGCKTNCPACARMCPQQAIIFPKYADPPINGAEVPAATADPGPTANPQSNDLYDRIRQRGGRKRFSTDSQEASAVRSCPTIDNLRRSLGIPDEVLTSLSPAELQRIAARRKGGEDRE